MTAIDMRINPITRQLERMEERMESRTKDLATRSDLEALRRELVARESLEPQLAGLRAHIERVDKARAEDRMVLNERIDAVVQDQISRQERLWMRLGPAAGIGGLIIAVLELLSRIKFTP